MTLLRFERDGHGLYSRVICSDCGTQITDGREPTIHGICQLCLTTREVKRKVDERRRAQKARWRPAKPLDTTKDPFAGLSDDD